MEQHYIPFSLTWNIIISVRKSWQEDEEYIKILFNELFEKHFDANSIATFITKIRESS